MYVRVRDLQDMEDSDVINTPKNKTANLPFVNPDTLNVTSVANSFSSICSFRSHKVLSNCQTPPKLEDAIIAHSKTYFDECSSKIYFLFHLFYCISLSVYSLCDFHEIPITNEDTSKHFK